MWNRRIEKFIQPVNSHGLLGAHQALLVAFPLFLFLGFTLVMLLLSFSEADFELDPAGLVVHVQWNQRIASALGFTDELFYFLRMQQQLAGPDRIRFDMRR